MRAGGAAVCTRTLLRGSRSAGDGRNMLQPNRERPLEFAITDTTVGMINRSRIHRLHFVGSLPAHEAKAASRTGKSEHRTCLKPQHTSVSGWRRPRFFAEPRCDGRDHAPEPATKAYRVNARTEPDRKRRRIPALCPGARRGEDRNSSETAVGRDGDRFMKGNGCRQERDRAACPLVGAPGNPGC